MLPRLPLDSYKTAGCKASVSHQQRHQARRLLRRVQQQEAEAQHGGAADVVVDVRHRKVQQLLHRAGVGGAAVRQRDGEHAAVADDGVQVPRHLLYQRLRALLPAQPCGTITLTGNDVCRCAHQAEEVDFPCDVL